MKERLPAFHVAEQLEQQFNRGVLSELTGYAQFVCWRAVRVNTSLKKLPIDPVHATPASVTNPKTWGTLDQALTALRKGNDTGIGFVFSENDPFTGIDIDTCVLSNNLTPQAGDLITELWSYTELSPSRTGLHIIVKGSVPEGRRRNSIEVYSTGRYFTLTTNHLKGSPPTIEERQPQLDRFYASLTPQEGRRQTIIPPQHHHSVSDEIVLEKAGNARNGERFNSLYRGNIAGFESKSHADFELVLRLLYWTNDNIEQVKRLFRRSGLYDRKTDRQTNGSTYLDMTIANALKKRRKR